MLRPGLPLIHFRCKEKLENYFLAFLKKVRELLKQGGNAKV